MSRAFRYNLILVLVALGTTLAAVAGWRFARASAPVSGPIVLVSIDSLRADALPAYGSKKVQTPALDALAADGVVFDRAYAHAPLTLPAHVALLSGRLPTETGVRDNVGASVPESLRLLSSMLADRGYATGGVVSSYALRKATGISNGFTFFDDELQPAESAGPAPSREAATAEHQGAAGAAPEAPIVSRDGAESERRAERWLSGTGSARAFLFLHLDEPHAPYTPPDAFAHVGAYEGEVAYADDLVGRLVAYLKKQQLYDESTIIVVGDHGESLGAHGEPEHGLLVLDDTVRVPLIIKRAGAEGRGTRIGELVQHVDIVPTILDLVNAPVPGGLSGRSLRPLFAGVSLGPRVAYSESVFPATQFGWTAQRTVTDGRFRYVSGPTPQLFDLEQDPESRTNISASHPEDVTRLAKALESFEATKVLPDAKPPAVYEILRRVAEAPVSGLERLGKASVAHGLAHEGALPGPAPLTPAQVPRGVLVIEAPGTWDHPTWKALTFEPLPNNAPHAFSFGYDGSRNLTQLTTPLAGASTATVDVQGLPVQVVDAAGTKLHVLLSGLARLEAGASTCISVPPQALLYFAADGQLLAA